MEGPCKESNARPNWRSLAEYPGNSNAQWAWEFLRRNPSYRADWARYSALPERIKSGRGSVSCDEPRARIAWFDLDPPPKPRETLWKYKRRVGNKYTVRPLCSALAEKYGIDHMADPGRAELWPSLRWNVDRWHFISQHTKKADYPVNVAAGGLWLKFNLAWPIEANLKRAKRALELFRDSFQSQHPKLIVRKRKLEKRRDLYRTYLQLLDAEEAGASHDEMAAALFPHIPNTYQAGYKGRGKVKDDLTAAKRLRDGDYLYLVL